ncbi:MAG: hypothetical protein H6938_05110 [Burkholderiales bacterium]|nr:hypothetical protein [Burkholderiales bacterium]
MNRLRRKKLRALQQMRIAWSILVQSYRSHKYLVMTVSFVLRRTLELRGKLMQTGQRVTVFAPALQPSI